MTVNERSIDTNAVNQQNGPDQQYDALSDDFGKGPGIPQAATLSDEGSVPGLPSQVLPRERRIQAIAWEKRRGIKLALMFLNADRFRTVNDALAALLPEGAERRKDAAINVAPQAPRAGVTIGISMDPDDGDHAETLIRHADIAVYHSENRAGNSYHFFTPGMRARAIE